MSTHAEASVLVASFNGSCVPVSNHTTRQRQTKASKHKLHKAKNIKIQSTSQAMAVNLFSISLSNYSDFSITLNVAGI